jgi:hypothetical protein
VHKYGKGDRFEHVERKGQTNRSGEIRRFAGSGEIDRFHPGNGMYVLQGNQRID